MTDPNRTPNPTETPDGDAGAGQRRPDQGGDTAPGQTQQDPATGGDGAAGAGGSGGFGT